MDRVLCVLIFARYFVTGAALVIIATLLYSRPPAAEKVKMDGSSTA